MYIFQGERVTKVNYIAMATGKHMNEKIAVKKE